MFDSKFLGLVITGFFETIYMTLAASLASYIMACSCLSADRKAYHRNLSLTGPSDQW